MSPLQQSDLFQVLHWGSLTILGKKAVCWDKFFALESGQQKAGSLEQEPVEGSELIELWKNEPQMSNKFMSSKFMENKTY